MTDRTASAATIARVLDGQASYDDLPEPAQAVVRAEWDRRIEAALADLDLTEELRAAGRPWAQADDQGVIMRTPGPSTARDQ